MKRKLFRGIMLTLLLILIYTNYINIQEKDTSGTIEGIIEDIGDKNILISIIKGGRLKKGTLATGKIPETNQYEFEVRDRVYIEYSNIREMYPLSLDIEEIIPYR